MNDSNNANIQDGTELMKPPAQPQSLGAVQEQARAIAEVQAAYVMAYKQPRDENYALQRILQMCKRTSLAERAEYCFPRGKSTVRGPSSDLMKQIGRLWKNIQTGIEELARYDGYSEVVAYATDLESNYRAERKFTVKHWRDTQGGGYRLKDERDIYEIIANMGARRRRACLEDVIPADIIEEAVGACRRTLEKDPLSDRIAAMVANFKKRGVHPDLLAERAEKSLKDFTHRDVSEFRALLQSIKDGEMSLSVVFPKAVPMDAGGGQKSPTGAAKGQGKGKKGGGQKKAPEQAQTQQKTAEKSPEKPQSNQTAQPQNDQPQQKTPEAAGPPPGPAETADLWSEVQATAKVVFKDQHAAGLRQICKEQGFNDAQLSEQQLSVLLDILIERSRMQG